MPRSEQSQAGSDAFYVSVLQSALRDGALRPDDRVLVVCGGPKDDASLRRAGLTNFEMSNISGDVAVDVENLAHADGSFDAVIVHSGLHHCASPHRGLLEMHRVASKCIILFEPADNFVTRTGRRLGIGQTYEFAAVADNGLRCAGWRNTSVPNWVYRFTAQEIRQTINCAAPFGPHTFNFYYRTRIPWRQLRARRNRLPLMLVMLAAPLLRLLDMFGPVTSNNLAAVVRKPDLPHEMFPWLQPGARVPEAKRSWFAGKFGVPPVP
ncbi:MAG: methyltransferase domain-containing protein [Chthoniobacterales bacterium]|nr:methyltransferase domain-containing protein [Chthoniobacterales bacterium]